MPDQVRIVAAEAKREDVRLPKLVWRRTLEKPGASDIAFPLARRGRHEGFGVESVPDRLGAGGKKKHSL